MDGQRSLPWQEPNTAPTPEPGRPDWRLAELAKLGHDVTQPVHALQLIAQQLEALPEGAARNAAVAELQGVSDSIASMFRNLLDYARLDAGGLQPHSTRLRIGALLSRILADHMQRGRPKGLQLGLLGDTALTVRADPMLLDCIVDHLLDNAVKYTREGQVLVRCRREGSLARLEVLDTGVGMAADELGQAQRAFYRGSAAQSLSVDGIGLGLTNATLLARLMQGDIVLHSEPGVGSRVVLTLPSA